MQENVPSDKLAGELEKQHKEGLSYFRRMGFIDKWPLYERFKAGDQWPAPTQRTKGLPRPVFNVIDMVESHKVASVMSEQINMVFSADEIDETNQTDVDVGDLFSRYSATTWERIKQDELNEEALDIGANTGTTVWHYYWDDDVIGGKKILFNGEMEGEVLDPINVFFGNPQQRKVQKQPYIIISSREMVKSVKKYARDQGLSWEMVNEIKPDKDTQDQGYDMARVEIDGTGKVTVLTRYWKGNDGKIYFAKVASGITIKKPTNTGLSLYPLVVMQWKRRRKSIHGVGDTDGLVPNQKAINTLIAMQILSVQLTGWPKLIHKSNAIDQSKVTNSPGEMIEDKSPPGTGDGIKYLNPPSMPTTASNLVDAILGYTRQMTGANDAATGTAPSSQLNATAIMLLQKAAAIPIESIKRRFYRAVEDIGRIWEEFWKIKYNLPRQVMLKDDDGNEYSEIFHGSQHADTPLNLKIDVGPSSMYSESLLLSSLQGALDKGYITYDQFLRYAPKNVVPFRDRLLKEIDQKKGIVSVIEQMIAQMSPQDQEMFAQLQPDQQLQLVQAMMLQQAPPQAQGVLDTVEAVQEPNMMPAIGM